MIRHAMHMYVDHVERGDREFEKIAQNRAI